MNGRHRILGPLFAAVLLLGLAGQALAAPASEITAKLTASTKCLLTVTVSGKALTGVAHIYVGWYEAGFQNADYPDIHDWVATSEYPTSNPDLATLKGKSILLYFGPTGRDSANHDWWALVQPYDANGAALPQITTNHLSTTCFVPSPA